MNCCNTGKCCEGNRCSMHKIGKVLLIVGGLNWGLYGLGMLFGGNWNVVNLLLGSWSVAEAVVYVLVGVAALMKLFNCRCKKCKEACAACSGVENTEQKM